MKLRGYGDIIGFKQSGIKLFKIADPVHHEKLFKLAENNINRLSNEEVLIYPNPSKGNFSVKGNLELVSIHLLDGKVVDYTQEGRTYTVGKIVSGILILTLKEGDRLFYQRIWVE